MGNKKSFLSFLGIGFVGALLVLVFIHRTAVLSLFQFRTYENNSVVDTPPVLNGASSLPGNSQQKSNGQQSINTSGKTNNTGAAELGALPPYAGRDPEEVRPVDEEIKIFTEDQRKQLYESIHVEGKAVKINPYHFAGWIQLGVLKKEIGDYEGARDAWEYASIVEPKNSLSFSDLGDLYWRYLKEYPKAEANLRVSISHKPDDTQNYVTLAELYYYSFKEKYDLAPGVLLEGLKANPGDQTLMRRLAYLYEQRGEYANALTWWQKVLDVNPGAQDVVDEMNQVKTKMK